MSNDQGPGYAFDPFATSSSARWGRSGAKDGEQVPELPNYEIRDKMGAGGMGSVWSARFLPLNQIRAIKFLNPSFAEDAEFLERFSQEAQAMGRLEHPNIVKVFDANADPAKPYIAMQWLSGETLTQLLAKRKLTPSEALRYFRDIADALDHAHSQGFTHRDLKPSNVMITKEGRAVLIDFGVASWMGNEGINGSSVAGTTRFLPPEVIEGRIATPASDIWAFAVLIYRTLTGQFPFEGGTPDQLFKKITSAEPAAPSNVSARVRAFLLRSFPKDPTKRAKRASQLVDELEQAMNPLPAFLRGDFAKLGMAAVLIGIFIFVGVKAMSGGGPPKPDAKTVATNAKGAPAAAGGELESVVPTKAAAKPKEEIAPEVADLKGAWFGDLGTQFAEGFLEPSGGRKFKLYLQLRDTNGLSSTVATGQIAPDGRAISFKDTQGSDFEGSLSDDSARITGTRDKASARFARSGDVVMTHSENAEVGLAFDLPAGWASQAENGGLTLGPIGNPNVRITVARVPNDPQDTAESVYRAMETDLRTLGGYTPQQNVTEATFGTERGFSWSFRVSRPGEPAVNGSVSVIPREKDRTVIQFWSPASDEMVWLPILDRVRKRFRSLDPGASVPAPTEPAAGSTTG